MPIISEVQWGKDNPVENAPTLTESELESLKKRMATMDKLLEEQGLAKFKIEAMFEQKHSVTKPTFGVLSFWQSGAKFHGGGDTKMYLCPGKDLGKSECQSFIPDASAGYGHLVCPKCGEVWRGEQVSGELGFRLSIQNWAIVLTRYFAKLEGNADIYAKYPRADIRAVAKIEQEKQHMGEKLTKARGELQKVIYPLKNIIKDTVNGADLQTRFYAFLRA